MECEALVIGAGPGGLTAAIYLARFHRHVEVFDAGQSRAKLIPVSHNCPGFAHGVSGPDLLERLRQQAAEHGVQVRDQAIRELARADAGPRSRGSGAEPRFRATCANDEIILADRVILATGVTDVLPEIDGVRAAICRGVVRICAICDAYETRGKRIAVFGPAEAAEKHAHYMRSFCADVTALAPPGASLIGIAQDRVLVQTPEGRREFDALYPVLGVTPNSALAAALGADCDEVGYLRVDAHQRTSVPGLFAIGDVAKGINQIAVATGHAAIAATAVHNGLPHKSIGTGRNGAQSIRA